MNPLVFAAAMYDEELALSCAPFSNEDHLSEHAEGGGYTALHFAAAGNMPDLAAALVKQGAKTELRLSFDE